MKAVLIEQLVKENELMKKKLQQIFLDVNHAYNYVYDNRHNEALTALSVVVMEVGTALHEVQHFKPVVIENFSKREKIDERNFYPGRERRSFSTTGYAGRRSSD